VVEWSRGGVDAATWSFSQPRPLRIREPDPTTDGPTTVDDVPTPPPSAAGATTVSRWAYESTTGTGITTPTASAVPGGAGLAALAFGAAGLRGRRRSRN
jgi:MYXO-CTERM domain-containing protein